MDNSLEEIRARADLVDIVGNYVPLRAAGSDRWKGCCPFHDEKTPSFYVSREKGFYNCFGCKAKGDVFKFLQQVENVSFPEAKRMLAERYGVALRPGRDVTPEQKAVFDARDKLFKVTAAAAAFFREQFNGNAGSAARDYARITRGLSRETCEKFGVGYAPDAWDSLRTHLTRKYGFTDDECAQAGLIVEKKSQEAQLGGMFESVGSKHYYDRFRHRLMFPIWDERGRVVAFGGRALDGGRTGNPDAKYLNSPEGDLFHKSKLLYGFHLARAEAGRRESVIVCEGYMDAIALHEKGFSHAVASLGTALTVQHVSLLKRMAPKRTFLCYDGDSAGMNAALRAAPLFSSHGLDVRVVTLPEGDDPDTFLRKHAPDEFERELRRAKLLGQFRLERATNGHDMTTLSGRMEAVRAGAEVVANVTDATERDAYVGWLVEKWKAAEDLTHPARIAAAESAIRREIDAASKKAGQTRDFRPQTPAQAANTSQASGHGDAVAAVESDVDAVTDTVSRSASGTSPGVFKAEQGLIAALLGSPSWRSEILQLLPPEQWTTAAHCEIALALRALSLQDALDMPALLEELSPEAGGIISELLLSDAAQYPATDIVIRDYVSRVRGHWAKQVEAEMLEYFKTKMQNGEPVTIEERERFRQALEGTGRAGWVEA